MTTNKRILGVFFLGLSFLTAGYAQAGDDSLTKQAIAERIKPVGEVKIEGQQTKNTTASGRSGEQVYQSACFACHGTGALNAPKSHNQADWQPRLAKGMDTLLAHAVNGFNAMPAKGACMNCTKQEITAAIKYMADQ